MTHAAIRREWEWIKDKNLFDTGKPSYNFHVSLTFVAVNTRKMVMGVLHITSMNNNSFSRECTLMSAIVNFCAAIYRRFFSRKDCGSRKNVKLQRRCTAYRDKDTV